jgi:hypothetical protein
MAALVRKSTTEQPYRPPQYSRLTIRDGRRIAFIKHERFSTVSWKPNR